MENNNIIESEERQLAIRERTFELSQRELKPFMGTAMIPPHLRDLGSLMILNNVAQKYKMDLLFLAQEMYIVKGKFAISGKLAIALINKSGQIEGRLKWDVRSDPFGVRAYAKIDGEDHYGMWVDDQMITLNGWDRNALWKSQKELMARYRSATYFARMEMPDVLMGFHTDDEVQDMNDLEVDKIEAGKGSINETVVENAPESFTEAIVDNESDEENKGINDVVAVQETAKDEKVVVVKHKRASKVVTVHYQKMEDAGVKRGHLAKVVQYFDLNETNIDKFVEDMQKYVDEFYASHEDLSPNPIKEVVEEKEPTEYNGEFDNKEDDPTEVFAGEIEHNMFEEKVEVMEEARNAKIEDAIFHVDAKVAGYYGAMLVAKIQRVDLIDFCETYKLTKDNIESYLPNLEEMAVNYYDAKAKDAGDQIEAGGE